MTKLEHTANVEVDGNIIYQNARAAISSARDLVAQYQTICEQVTAASGISKGGIDMEKDFLILQNILYNQGEAANNEVHRLLHDRKKDGEDHQMCDANHELWTRFALASTQEQLGVGTGSEQGWAVAAKRAKRAVHRMVRDLPEHL